MNTVNDILDKKRKEKADLFSDEILGYEFEGNRRAAADNLNRGEVITAGLNGHVVFITIKNRDNTVFQVLQPHEVLSLIHTLAGCISCTADLTKRDYRELFEE